MRSPISRVRSVTDTSMMFMIPMPPTTIEIAAMLASSSVSVRLVCCSVPAISSKVISSSCGRLAGTNTAADV
jgi:hypothetical protein